ncbi:Endoribonuclease L-PSP/chorismate mutase-like protein [Kalaharituber pfeilii]|nr:Endoribonuclease L-PSP/chorismate mutase-like protein [Kalaharituber pfeilii]
MAPLLMSLPRPVPRSLLIPLYCPFPRLPTRGAIAIARFSLVPRAPTQRQYPPSLLSYPKRQAFPPSPSPATTTATAIHARTMSELTAVFSPDAAPPAGPYSQAIKAAGLVFVSGQIPADSQGNIIEGEIEVCTEQCLKNLSEVLAAAGTDITKVVKTTVFLADMSDFARVNAIYSKWFSAKPQPARSCVAVKTLPKGVRVEIECIALQ